jgi:penicillin G amidase
MKLYYLLVAIILLQLNAVAQQNKLVFPQLQKPVEIITDQWGVAHIYAQTENDLFFTQGYQAAKDRLYQLEIFRRKATGTMAEVLGKKALKRDIGARLFKFRGNLDAEYAHYHPRGKAIIQSFVNGINARIKQVLMGEMPLPFELQLLNIQPGYWTPEVVISRHNGLLTNVQDELATARLLQKMGEDKLRLITDFHPQKPDLHIDTAIDAARLNDGEVLALYNAFRTQLVFSKEDILAGLDTEKNAAALAAELAVPNSLYKQTEGSNNWVISGSRTANGLPMLANDPHRAITVPSLRYIVHLSCPGWNVVGGGEPTLPGISIGHNNDGAWGLTIFETDAEDLYVYKLNPADPSQYFYKGQWIKFKQIRDTISVKNDAFQSVSLYYSVHGPVTFIDSMHHIAYAVKCGWLEKGGAPYLASLRMDQAKNWNEFKAACNYSYMPGENMIWADKQGHIGWQTVGIAPIRNYHSGMVPVPGDGRYEWNGYLPVLKRPAAYDPTEGFICTANEDRTPKNYPYMNTIGFSWADAFRHDRIAEVLGSNNKISMDDMQALQTDYYCMPARQLIPLLDKATSADTNFIQVKKLLLSWDLVMSAASIPATVYVEWERCLGNNLLKHFDIESKEIPIEFNLQKMIALLSHSDKTLGENFIAVRDQLLITSIQDAVNNLSVRLGNNKNLWRYGQLNNKYVWIKHSLSTLVDTLLLTKINAGPVARGGNENSVNSTGSNMNQNAGASFRVLIDCKDWDLMRAINTPGQSGNPNSNHYKDLFELWNKNQYFPLYFTKEKVQSVKENVLVLSAK